MVFSNGANDSPTWTAPTTSSVPVWWIGTVNSRTLASPVATGARSKIRSFCWMAWRLTARQVLRSGYHPCARIQQLHVDARLDELAQRRFELPRRDVLGLQQIADAWGNLATDLVGAQGQPVVHAAGQALLQGEVQQ